MTNFPAYASNFEVYPKDGAVFRHLSPLLDNLNRINFMLRVDDPVANQGQMASNFDIEMKIALVAGGATPFDLRLPANIPQELDFAFAFDGKSVAVEIEKANREKILRDILKCHMYLHAGADFALVALPKNYSHTHGVWNLFEFGIQRFSECKTYGFGTTDRLGRILLVGFEQFAASSDKPLCKQTRLEMRKQAASPVGGA
jgi:hypothetical protein